MHAGLRRSAGGHPKGARSSLDRQFSRRAQGPRVNVLDFIRVWVARWLLPADFMAMPVAPLKDFEERLVKLHRLTWTSGHLSRAYHVGRVVRQETEAALDALLLAEGRTGCETNDTYASPMMRRIYGGKFDEELTPVSKHYIAGSGDVVPRRRD